MYVVGVGVEQLVVPERVENQIGVGQLCTLGLTGRPARVQHHRCIRGLGGLQDVFAGVFDQYVSQGCPRTRLIERCGAQSDEVPAGLDVMESTPRLVVEPWHSTEVGHRA